MSCPGGLAGDLRGQFPSEPDPNACGLSGLPISQREPEQLTARIDLGTGMMVAELAEPAAQKPPR